MFNRRHVAGLSLVCLALSIAGCAVSGLDSIQVSPATQTLRVGQTTQLIVTGTYGNGNHLRTQTVTTGLTWTSTSPGVATVNSTGMVTAVNGGTTTITATAMAFNGSVTSTAGITVTGSTGGTTGGSGAGILSLTIIPSGIVFGSLRDNGQFLAIGTFSTSPTVRDLTNSVTWFTSEPNGFPITNNNSPPPGGGTQNGGVVSAYEASVGPVGAVITAEATDTNGSIAPLRQTSAALWFYLIRPPIRQYQALAIQDPPLLTTLTVYNEGLNTTNWLVTASSATGTPNVLTLRPRRWGWQVSLHSDLSRGTTVTLTAPRNRSLVRWLVLQLLNVRLSTSGTQLLHRHDCRRQNYCRKHSTTKDRGSNLQLRNRSPANPTQCAAPRPGSVKVRRIVGFYPTDFSHATYSARNVIYPTFCAIQNTCSTPKREMLTSRGMFWRAWR